MEEQANATAEIAIGAAKKKTQLNTKRPAQPSWRATAMGSASLRLFLLIALNCHATTVIRISCSVMVSANPW